MKRIIVTFVAVLIAFGSFGCGMSPVHTSGEASVSAQGAKVYACPMHPEQHSDHPGKCPICGMSLEPEPGGGDEAAAGTQEIGSEGSMKEPQRPPR
jgi:hypothetical protein